MTLSRSVWYRPYLDSSITGRSLASVRADQQMAGAVMWGIGGIVAAGEGVALFAGWLRSLDHVTSSTVGPLTTAPTAAPGTGQQR
jgi:cytochrome c oxidase assembly factor CtaG